MNDYRPHTGDHTFLLFDVLQVHEQLAALPLFAGIDCSLMMQILEEASRFVGEVVAPLNRAGDASGCRFEDGAVTTPPGFAAAYAAFWKAGWPALACAPEDGGQGLPWVLDGVLYEILSAANHGWTMAPGLLHGAYECLRQHGDAALKQYYLPRIASGEWLTTMCLTEPHAGSDLGLVRTQAAPGDGGSHRLTGTKIFISGGEHDMTDNIVHLVLAREPGAPPGPKGLSLFLCPKQLPGGPRNAVHCERIEEKMGLHGSPTCVMRFDEAVAWRVGDAGRGLAAMFVMMNAARLHVALQGVGLLDAAWQKANAYAQERLQMRAPGSATAPGGADPIGRHPAIRRILDSQRAWIDGTRLLCYRTGVELDLAKHHPDPQRRGQAERWCSLVTPILKSLCTQQAFEGASECLQVFGGHGYVKEWGIEQVVRDSRVTMIYEGTNEIQAIDLLVRKVLADEGHALLEMLDRLEIDLSPEGTGCLVASDAFARLRRVTRLVCACNGRDPEIAYWIAQDFLRMAGIALVAWAWACIEQEADVAADPDRWRLSAKAFRNWLLPELELRADMIASTFARAKLYEEPLCRAAYEI